MSQNDSVSTPLGIVYFPPEKDPRILPVPEIVAAWQRILEALAQRGRT